MFSATERWTRLAFSVIAVAACGEDAEPSAMEAQANACFVGDASTPVEFEVIYRTADGEIRPTEEMAEIPLIQPPQGGKVMFVGVRARNVNGCGLTLATALCEPADGSVVSLERRPVTLERDADGWLSPQRPSEPSNYSNLPACPRADLARSIADEIYELRVSIADVDGRRASTSLQVVPTCGEPERSELCRCECSKDYKLGGGCALAGGGAP